jgi:hypothetical protein
MFSDLTDFSVKRTGVQALGFYISYLVLIMATAAIIGIIAGIIAGEDTEAFSNGFRLGTLVAIAISIILSFAILKAKKLTSSFTLSLLAICAGVLALIGGGILGLIIPAIFTTKGKTKKKKK